MSNRNLGYFRNFDLTHQTNCDFFTFSQNQKNYTVPEEASPAARGRRETTSRLTLIKGMSAQYKFSIWVSWPDGHVPVMYNAMYITGNIERPILVYDCELTMRGTDGAYTLSSVGTGYKYYQGPVSCSILQSPPLPWWHGRAGASSAGDHGGGDDLRGGSPPPPPPSRGAQPRLEKNT